MLQEVAAAERRPVGSTNENVRGAACAIRSTRVPVPPGCENSLVDEGMREIMPAAVDARSAKLKTEAAEFSEKVPDGLLERTLAVRTELAHYLRRAAQAVDL